MVIMCFELLMCEAGSTIHDGHVFPVGISSTLERSRKCERRVSTAAKVRSMAWPISREVFPSAFKRRTFSSSAAVQRLDNAVDPECVRRGDLS